MRRQAVLIAIGVLVVLVVVAAVLLAAARPPIPGNAGTTLIARVMLSGAVLPDPTVSPESTGDVDPDIEGIARSPTGQACLDRMQRGSGWADLCWEGYRLGADSDPAKDYYFLRIYGSHQGLRWMRLRSELVGLPRDNVYDVWPDGTYEGGCRQEPVSMLVPLFDLAPEYMCGRTEAHLDADHWSHVLTWTCEDCLFPNSDTRGITMYAVVGMPAGSIPSWNLFADSGT